MTAPFPPRSAHAPSPSYVSAPRREVQSPALHPRWVLLAALPLMTAVLIGIWVHGYYTTHACSLGALQFLCGLDLLPGILQVLGILAFAGLVLIVVRRIGRAYDPEQPADGTNGAHALLWRLTEYPRVRTLAWILAGLIALGLVVDALGSRLDVATVVVGLIALYAMVRGATYRPLPPSQPSQPMALPDEVSGDGPAYTPRQRPARVLGWMLPRPAHQTAPLAHDALASNALAPSEMRYGEAPMVPARPTNPGPFSPLANAVVESAPVAWLSRALDKVVNYVTSRFLDRTE